MSFEYVSIPISGLLPFTNSMQLQMMVSDLNPNVNITEAGFDHFSITNQPTAALNVQKEENWVVYPNPGSSILQLKGNRSIGEYTLVDLTGKEYMKGTCLDSFLELQTDNLQAGMYLLRFQNQVVHWVKQ
jgi:hypothetical protein